ncbi:FAD-binding oxidoreductase, partial [Deltaproteobacteria bacterium OttesenSCG-928-K17]|nr:FAD-binding oxidoreductase [Deltaproteobacteria bacterium OttesenSCG-928-K17]
MTMQPQSPAEAAVMIQEAKAAGRPLWPAGRLGRLSGWKQLDDKREGIISAARLNKVVSVEPENLLAVVEAGLTPAEVRRAIAPAGLCWPVSGHDNRSLGAIMAEGAVSLETMARGPMTDWILGTSFVEPSGRLISSGGRTLKNVSGYDLTRLHWKAWGSLGFVTGFILKCLPLPECSQIVEFQVDDAKAAALAVENIIKARIFPQGLHAVFKEGRWSVLLWLNGFADFVKAQSGLAQKAARADALKIHDDAESFWDAHQAAWPLYAPCGGAWLGSRADLIGLIEVLGSAEAGLDSADIDLGGGLARINFQGGSREALPHWPKGLEKEGP